MYKSFRFLEFYKAFYNINQKAIEEVKNINLSTKTVKPRNYIKMILKIPDERKDYINNFRNKLHQNGYDTKFIKGNVRTILVVYLNNVEDLFERFKRVYIPLLESNGIKIIKYELYNFN